MAEPLVCLPPARARPPACLPPICAGVLGRVNELAKPIDRKFNLAMAVVLGKDFDSVVVEDGEGALPTSGGLADTFAQCP